MNDTHTELLSQEVRPRGGTGFRNRGSGRPPRFPPRNRYGAYYRGGGSPYLIESSRDHGAPASELIRWAQECLNRARQLRLPVDGIADLSTRSALRSFQSQRGLPATGILGPDTVEALRKACAAGGSCRTCADGSCSACAASAGTELEANGAAEEVKAAINKAVAALPANVTPPSYVDRGTLDQAIAFHKGRAEPGLYVIRFTVDGKRMGYSGKAENLAKRLMQHRMCAQMLGLSVAKHRVMTAVYPTSASVRRDVEKRINDYVRTQNPGRFTNQRRELELAVLGETWS